MSERTVIQSLPRNHVLSVPQQASVYEAACQMCKAHSDSVLILDDAGSLIGILTERDLLTKIVAQLRNPESTLVSEVMTRNPYFVAPDTTVADAVLIMQRRNFRHLPIVSSSAEILGVFSIRDALPREILEAENLAEHIDQQFTDVLG